jgi:tetratricopeptide (TPR) repeat protein
VRTLFATERTFSGQGIEQGEQGARENPEKITELLKKQTMNFFTSQIRRVGIISMAGSPQAGCVQRRIVLRGLLLAALAGASLIPTVAQTAANEAVLQQMRQGSEAMAAGNFSAAVTAYAAVTQKMPEFAEGYLNLGLALHQAGQLEDARAALEKAVRLKPGLRGANLFLGIIAYRENRFKDAESRLLLETRLDPRNAKAFMWLGVSRLAEDDPQGAIAPLDKAYALAPTDVDILYHRGRAYLLVANRSYAAMYKQDPDSLRVHQVLAESYADSFRAQDAINEFELAVKVGPRQPGLHEELGDQYWVAGQFDKAAEAYREELRIDAHAVTAKYKLGCFLVFHQQTAEGVELLREVLREDPSLADAHYYLGNGLMALDQDQEAIHEYELAVEADPSNNRAISANYKLAQLYRKYHRVPEAQAAMQNFQRLRAEANDRRESKSAQIVRKRTELPVEDTEKTAISADH